jgi:glycosyltransferase involved in cell wall biosynthesis
MLGTAKYLRELGVEVDIKLGSEAFQDSNYEILHCFDLIRPASILPHLDSKLPLVISPIYVDYMSFEKQYRQGFSGKLFRHLSRDQIEYVKVLARWLRKGERPEDLSYVTMGHAAAIKKVFKRCDMLLPNSESEYQRLSKDYHTQTSYQVVVNGIDEELFHEAIDGSIKDQKMVLCVGRIEGRKNQLNLIRALNNTDFELYLIGEDAPNQANYAAQCRAEAASNVHFIPRISQEELRDYYRRAKVHVLASYFETTGLSSLEAAAYACNLVVSDGGDTRDYFNGEAYFCKADDVKDIYEKVKDAANAPSNVEYRDYVLEHYTWRKAAEQTFNAYQAVLKNVKNR